MEPSVEHFDPLHERFLRGPHPWLSVLREQAPVHYVADRGMWWVTGYELVREAMRQPEIFSSEFGAPQSTGSAEAATRVAEIQAQGWEYVPTMLTRDPPAHDRYRRLVRGPFTSSAVARLEPQVQQVVDELVADVLDAGDVEFVDAFAAPLPLRIIAMMLGVPGERLADFRRWSGELTRTIGADLDDDGRVYQAEQILEFERYFAAELERRPAEPAEDLLSTMATGELSIAECLSLIRQLLVAGNETSTKLLSSTVHLLAADPEWWRWLREDPDERVPGFVEEALRLFTPVAGMFRVTTRDASLGEATIPKGARVVLSYAAANRDPAVFADPDTLDPARTSAEGHLAFGHGIHFCLGAPLARLQARIALTTLTRRAETLEPAGKQPVRHSPSFLLRGVERLWVRFR